MDPPIRIFLAVVPKSNDMTALNCFRLRNGVAGGQVTLMTDRRTPRFARSVAAGGNRICGGGEWSRADKCTHAHRAQPPRGRGVKRRDGAGRTGAGCTSISSLLSRFAYPAQFGSDCLPEGRTTHGVVVLPARRLVGGREDYCSKSGARRGRAGGGVEEVWSGREEKEKKCADKREKSRVARKRRQDSVGRKRPIDKVSEQVVPRDKRRRGHYCLSNCGRVPLGPRERGQSERKERERALKRYSFPVRQSRH